MADVDGLTNWEKESDLFLIVGADTSRWRTGSIASEPVGGDFVRVVVSGAFAF